MYSHEHFKHSPCEMKHLLFAFLISLSACTDWASEREVQRAMRIYDNLYLKMDFDSIAATFISDGNLGPIKGRDSIRRYLKTVENAKVLDYKSKPVVVTIDHDIARQEGTYVYKIVTNGDTLSAGAKYFAVWKKINGRWYLESWDSEADTSTENVEIQ